MTQQAYLSSIVSSEVQVDQINGLPYFGRNQQQYLHYWRWQSKILLSSYQNEITLLKKQRQSAKKNPLALDKCDKLIQSYQANYEILKKILGEDLTSEMSQRVVSQKGVGAFDISKDFENIFRDWVWDDSEIQSQLNLIDEVTGSDVNPKDVLIIGGGSGRLAFELHQKLGAVNTTILDINPLLLSAANKVYQQEEIELVEIPPYPFLYENIAIKRNVKSSQSFSEGCHLVLGDFREDLFKKKSFDLVITPWIIDVIESPLGELLSSIHGTLKDQGQWLNIGPLIFQSTSPLRRWTLQEIKGLSSEVGFEIETVKEDRIQQIASPINGMNRHDQVFCWCAKKQERKANDLDRYQVYEVSELPEFFNKLNKPVQLNMKLDEVIETHSLMVDILHCAKSGMSIQQIAEDLAEEYQTGADQLVPVVHKLLFDFYKLNLQR